MAEMTVELVAVERGVVDNGRAQEDHELGLRARTAGADTTIAMCPPPEGKPAGGAETGISLMHVPFKGSGQSVPAALAGDVPLLITSFAGAGAHIRAGTLKLLEHAVQGRLRHPSLFDKALERAIR